MHLLAIVCGPSYSHPLNTLTSPASAESGSNSLKRAYLAFGAMLAGVCLAASDLTVVSTILPQVIFDLGIPLRTGISQAAWLVNGYLLAYTVAMPLMGRVSDFTGRRNAFLASLFVFGAGSLVAGSARSLEVMVVGRVVQALGAGALVPVTMAYAADVVLPARRAWAFGIVGAVDTAGWVVGPLYGAAMVTLAQWHWIFYINVPFCVLVSAALLVLMRGERVRSHFSGWSALDVPGTLLFSVLIASVTLALSGTQDESGGSAFAAQGGLNPFALPLLLAALLAALLLVRRERHAPQPFLPPDLFADRAVVAACLANFMVGAALIVAMVNVPLFVNVAVAETLAEAPLRSGMALAVLTLGMAGGSLAGGRSAQRLGLRVTAIAGVLCAAAGFALMSSWFVAADLLTLAPGLAVCGIGIGLVIAPLASAVIDPAPPTHRGVASALVLITRLVGMAVGLAALATWGVDRFNALSIQLPPVNLADPNAARILLDQARATSVQVLQELFIAAAVLCALAGLPSLWISDRLTAKSDMR